MSVAEFRRDVCRLMLICYGKLRNQVVPREIHGEERPDTIITIYERDRNQDSRNQ
jgi:hypothetical protein